MSGVREAATTSPAAALPSRSYGKTRRIPRSVVSAALLVLFVGNAVAIVWLWYHGGNITGIDDSAEALTSVARLTGLLGAYLALVQVLLLARIPWLERVVGFDRLTVVHRWNGHVCIDLVIAHTVLVIWGYALLDDVSLPDELRTMFAGNVYPGMITAAVGTALLVVVVATSLAVARRRLSYEWWYAVHLVAYAGIALAWFHQIPTGNELAFDEAAADYWRALYVVTLAALVVFRILVPAVNSFRYRLRVAEVVREAPGVVSLRITGRGLDRLDARPGQFFLWRFLSRGRWWESHPFSLSEAPDGRSFRITAKAVGDFSRGLADVPPGTPVLAEGPFGVFTSEARHRSKVLLIAGGIGITPIRALLDELEGDVIVLYRVIREEDVVFRDELERARARVTIVAGDHAAEDGGDLLSPKHLLELVPDVAERDVFVSGPPALTALIAEHVHHAGVHRRQVHIEKFAL
jgi:predicted ferric reductase